MSTLSILFLLLGLLALQASISATETAFFSLRPWRIERFLKEKPGPGRTIAEALKDPRVFLVSMVIGIELASVGISNLAAILTRRYEGTTVSENVALMAGVAITSAILVLLGDLLPKSLAVNFPETAALRLARPVWFFLSLVRPVAAPVARLAALLTESRRSRAPSGGGPVPLSEEDFRTLIDISRREGVLKSGQTEMIEAAFRLGDLQVRQVMVPRPDILAIRETAGPGEALEAIRASRHSRIPVYGDSLDEIRGVLYAKDLLAQRFGLRPPAAVRDLARPVLFVPEVMRARQLVRELQARKVHLAVVVDEYGGTAGVITLEDLLEEMVGEFSDEFDRPVRLFRRVRRGVFWVRAGMPIPEFARRVRVRIKDPEVDTIGGYVLKLFDRVPAEGDSVSDDHFTFTVRRMKGRRIMVLLVERHPAAGAGGGAARKEKRPADGIDRRRA